MPFVVIPENTKFKQFLDKNLRENEPKLPYKETIGIISKGTFELPVYPMDVSEFIPEGWVTLPIDDFLKENQSKIVSYELNPSPGYLKSTFNIEENAPIAYQMQDLATLFDESSQVNVALSSIAKEVILDLGRNPPDGMEGPNALMSAFGYLYQYAEDKSLVHLSLELDEFSYPEAKIDSFVDKITNAKDVFPRVNDAVKEMATSLNGETLHEQFGIASSVVFLLDDNDNSMAYVSKFSQDLKNQAEVPPEPELDDKLKMYRY